MVIYITNKNDESTWLHKYDRATKRTVTLFQGVDTSSQLRFINNKDIMFVTKLDDQFHVVAIDDKRNFTHLVNGRYHVSLAIGEIIYKNSTSL